MDEFEIIFYETVDGKCPVTDFMDSLPKKMREKIFKAMDILRLKGNNLREPYGKSLEDGIFELRCKVGSDITRTLNVRRKNAMKTFDEYKNELLKNDSEFATWYNSDERKRDYEETLTFINRVYALPKPKHKMHRRNKTLERLWKSWW